MLIFQNDTSVSEGTSNVLVANMYWRIAFKIFVFDASLFEETPYKSHFALTPELP